LRLHLLRLYMHLHQWLRLHQLRLYMHQLRLYLHLHQWLRLLHLLSMLLMQQFAKSSTTPLERTTPLGPRKYVTRMKILPRP
jgi:hypothetical protein